MMIRVTKLAGASIGALGKFFRSRVLAGLTQQHVEVTVPTGSLITDTRTSSVTYRNRSYLAGMATDNMVFDEYGRLHRSGMQAPPLVPTLTAGAGPGPSGKCKVRLAFFDPFTDEWSPMSGASNEVTLSNSSRVIGNVPTVAPDSRSLFIGVWVEMNGAEPRLSVIRQLSSATTITENLATLRLGIAFFELFEKMPRGLCGAAYHDRYCVAGDALHPDVLYVSAPFKPERWESLSFATRHGEPIVALAATNEVLLAFSPWNCYALRGYTEDDMVFEQIDAKIGAFGQQSVVVINGNVWVFNQLSGFLYNGAFHNILKDREKEWRDSHKANPDIYERGLAFHNPTDFQVGFIATGFTSNPDTVNIPNPDGVVIGTVIWTADYRPTVPALSGTFEQPDWATDIMVRRVESAGLVAPPHGKRQELYLGFNDGKSRIPDPTDSDDDGDGYGKRLFIRTGHYLMSDPGGDVMEGKTLERAWSYVESEQTAWTFYAKGGDEYAYRHMTPDNVDHWWKESVAASELVDNNYTYAPETVHPHAPQLVTGRGFTFEWTWETPLGVVWRGLGGVHGPGPTTRLPVSFQGGA